MTFRLGLVGAGLIGRRHADAIRQADGVELAGIADPSAAGQAVAEAHGSFCVAGLGELIEAARPDGIILATPNTLHVPQALDCVAAGMPVLVEKPIASDAAEARRLVEAAEAAGVPVLVGHHRRHNPLIAQAKRMIAGGALGRVVAVHGQFWLMKPDDYFDVDWRRQPGAGPVLVNMIHDIDLLRYLVGEVEGVRALTSNAVRGHAVEETAAVLLGFAGGALGTFALSDTVVAPWSWELTARENPAYPATGQSCYLIGGTHGSLSLPDLTLWHNDGKRSWWEPMSATRAPVPQDDPLVAQVLHFADVIRGAAQPLVPGREGLRTLEVIEAVLASARAGGAEVRPGRE